MLLKLWIQHHFHLLTAKQHIITIMKHINTTSMGKVPQRNGFIIRENSNEEVLRAGEALWLKERVGHDMVGGTNLGLPVSQAC